MPKRINPQDQWETDFLVPLPGEPRNIGPLETLFQRLLNRTERLKNRIGAILGTAWDSTPPDTLAGLAGRVGTLESLAAGNAHLDRGFVDSPVDWNSLTAPGSYKIHIGAFGSGATNYPPTTYQFGILLVFRSDSPAAIVQVYIPHELDDYIYLREAWYGTDWSPWRTLGATYGQNSNGFYIRFGDGTQVCWALGVGAGPDPQIVTYPAAFLTAPAVVVTPADWPPAHISVDSTWGYGTTQQRFRKYNADGSVYAGTAFFLNYIAIGRWR